MNNTLSMVFEFCVNLLQGIIFVTFCNRFFEPKFKKPVNIICYIATVMAMFVAINIQNNITLELAFSEIVLYCIVMFLYTLLCLKGKWYMKIAIPLLGYGLCLGVSLALSYFSAAVLGLDSSNIFGHQSFIYRVVMVLVVNMIYILLFYLIIKIFKDKIRLKSYTDILFFLVLPILAVLVLFMTFSIATDSRTSDVFRIYLGIISFVIFTVVVLMLNAMVKVTKSNELKTQNLLMKKEQQMYRNEIDNASKYIREIAKVKHDMKNQILCISEMLDSDSIEEAQNMCRRISDELKETSEVFNSSNVYLNSILNVIYKKAKEKEIDIRINIGSDYKEIDGSDLITIIGNLCDNAIEASQKQSGEKILRLSLVKRGEYYIMIVKNHIEDSVLNENPKLYSDKKDSIYHGYGIKSVRSLVKKYNGDIQIAEEEEMFVVRLMLEIPNFTK